MKKEPKLFVLLMLISIAACKKSSPPAEEHIQLKNIQNDIELSNAIGDLITGYGIGFSHYATYEDRPSPSREFYRCLWIRTVQAYTEHRIELSTATSVYLVADLLNNPNRVTVDDPRLHKPPYTHIHITKNIDNNTLLWNYSMYVDSYYRKKFNQIAHISGTLYTDQTGSAYAPTIPSDEAMVTSFLGLIEPAPVN